MGEGGGGGALKQRVEFWCKGDRFGGYKGLRMASRLTGVQTAATPAAGPHDSLGFRV